MPVSASLSIIGLPLDEKGQIFLGVACSSVGAAESSGRCACDVCAVCCVCGEYDASDVCGVCGVAGVYGAKAPLHRELALISMLLSMVLTHLNSAASNSAYASTSGVVSTASCVATPSFTST